MGLFDKLFKRNKEEQEQKDALNQGLEKTKEGFFSKIAKAIAGKDTVDETILDEVENALISADVGLDTTVKIIEGIEARVARDKYVGTAALNQILQEEMMALLTDAPDPGFKNFNLPAGKKPYVILVVGVNGVGKTTTIGKLAHNFQLAGHKVILGAADTFRAAAVDQLSIWSERTGVGIVKKEMGSDPSAVAFEAVQQGIAQDADVVIIDTAGRLHNKAYLMDELSKIRRVISKKMPDAPHEVLLVLDGSTGQNAMEQAKQFTAATDVTALAITKLDGTAKGGVVLGIAAQFKVPVKYIGVGEKAQDLQIFNKIEFVDSLFSLK
ncbi:MAG: signal recognition particle-docking protein FtsY [Bacteroidetes bacterium]|nr:signal recognition particle-docking protein FtsY [Bacteroidota bacterium]